MVDEAEKKTTTAAKPVPAAPAAALDAKEKGFTIDSVIEATGNLAEEKKIPAHHVKAYTDYAKSLKVGDKLKNMGEFAAEQATKGSDLVKKGWANTKEIYETHAPKELKDMVGQVVDEGRVVYDVVTGGADADKNKKKDGNFFKDNAGSLMAGGLAMLAGALLGMDILAILLIALVVAAVVGVIGGTGIFAGFAGPKEKKTPGGDEPVRQPTIETPSLSKVKVREGGKPVGLVNGEEKFGVATDVTFEDSKVGFVTGKVTPDNGYFAVTELADRLPDGRRGPAFKLEQPVKLAIGSNDTVDLTVDALKGDREQASKLMQDYAKEIPLKVDHPKLDKPEITATLGTVEVEGKHYTVVARGVSKDGNKGEFTSAILQDAEGKPISNSKGEAIAVALAKPVSADQATPDPEKPLEAAIKDGNAMVMQGDVKSLTKLVGNQIVQLKAKDTQEVKQAQEKTKKEVTDALAGDNISAEKAAKIVGRSYTRRLMQLEVNGGAAALGGSEIERLYLEDKFRQKSPEQAAKDVAAKLQTITALDSENPSLEKKIDPKAIAAIEDDVKLMHKPVRDAFDKKSQPQQADKGQDKVKEEKEKEKNEPFMDVGQLPTPAIPMKAMASKNKGSPNIA